MGSRLRLLATVVLLAAPARAGGWRSLAVPTAPILPLALAPVDGSPGLAVHSLVGIAPQAPGAMALALPSLPALPALPASAASLSLPPGAPAAAQAALAPPASSVSAGRQAPAANAQLAAAAPGDGPRPAGSQIFDGAGRPAASADPAADLTALGPVEQLAASGFYAPTAERHSWASADEAGGAWLKFYRSLYRSLSALPPGHPFRSETPRGPVFAVGGSDVAQAILRLPRSVPDNEVNLFGRAGRTPDEVLDSWMTLNLDGTGGAQAVRLNPESTTSLARMSARRPAGGEALDAAPSNVLLKWHALALTPDGLEVRALDAASARDLGAGKLRLSSKLGLLGEYSLHYDLLVAYRALEESPRRWTLDPASARLMADSARALPAKEAEKALRGAAEGLAAGAGISQEQAEARLLDFVGKRLGPEARAALRRAPEGPAPESQRSELLRLASPFRTETQLAKLAAAPRAPGTPFRFAVIGDAEPGRFWVWRKLFNRPGIFWRQLAAADREAVDFVFQLGDMVSRGVVRNFLEFFRRLAAQAPRHPYLTAIGNHDRRNPHGVTDSKLYRSLFGPTDYSFDRGGYRFVVLDSSAQRVTPEQLRWLDQVLDTPLRKVVFTHVPPAPLSVWTDWGKFKGAGGFKQGGEEFTEIVSRRGVDRVYLGHIHTLDAMTYRGVRYVLTGGGGSPLFPTRIGDPRHHYLVVDADAEGLVENPRFH